MDPFDTPLHDEDWPEEEMPQRKDFESEEEWREVLQRMREEKDGQANQK